eukprot:UN19982
MNILITLRTSAGSQHEPCSGGVKSIDFTHLKYWNIFDRIVL